MATAALLRSGRGPMLPAGAGSSIGDCGSLSGGPLLDSRPTAAIHDFDPVAGVVTADAGVSLAAILERILPTHVLPAMGGALETTLGGAIATDLFGPNQHRRGSIGASVTEITLRRSDVAGAITLRQGSTLFAATVGGMGMTGLIERARLKVMAVPAAGTVRERAVRLPNLAAFFGDVGQEALEHEYAVAWIDGRARGRALGRGLLLLGDHGEAGWGAPAATASAMPPPGRPRHPLVRRVLDWAASAAGRMRTLPCGDFFLALGQGPRAGVLRHQCVIPAEAAERTVRALIAMAQAAGQPPELCLLQRLGESRSPALLGFGRPGTLLTLDLPTRGPQTLRLLDALDAEALGAGGAVNPATDRRMAAATFARSCPAWRAVEKARDPAIQSDFWRRTALALAAEETFARAFSRTAPPAT